MNYKTPHFPKSESNNQNILFLLVVVLKQIKKRGTGIVFKLHKLCLGKIERFYHTFD